MNVQVSILPLLTGTDALAGATIPTHPVVIDVSLLIQSYTKKEVENRRLPISFFCFVFWKNSRAVVVADESP